MNARIWRRYTFEAAHYLPNVPAGHKCAAMHGHSYAVRVFFDGSLRGDRGWVKDFGRIDQLCKPVIEKLDHSVLNEHPGLENPTSENLAVWLLGLWPTAEAVEVSETSRSGCHIERDWL